MEGSFSSLFATPICSHPQLHKSIESKRTLTHSHSVKGLASASLGSLRFAQVLEPENLTFVSNGEVRDLNKTIAFCRTNYPRPDELSLLACDIWPQTNEQTVLDEGNLYPWHKLAHFYGPTAAADAFRCSTEGDRPERFQLRIKPSSGSPGRPDLHAELAELVEEGIRTITNFEIKFLSALCQHGESALEWWYKRVSASGGMPISHLSQFVGTADDPSSIQGSANKIDHVMVQVRSNA